MEFCGNFDSPDCYNCVVRTLSSFCGTLDENEINTFMRIKRGHIYEKNQAIFYEGNSSEGMYILCSGSVKLVQSSHKGKQQILEVVSPGNLIEKTTLFHTGKHNTTGKALERSEVSFFYREEFLSVLQSNNHLALNLIRVLSQEVERGQERNRQILFKTAKERLADTLLALSHKRGVRHDKDITISLDLTREELAEMVGVTLETVVRLLALLKKEKLIGLVGKKVLILDEEKLMDVRG